MSLYDFYHIDTGCKQFAFGYVFKNLNPKAIDSIFLYKIVKNDIFNIILQCFIEQERLHLPASKQTL